MYDTGIVCSHPDQVAAWLKCLGIEAKAEDGRVFVTTPWDVYQAARYAEDEGYYVTRFVYE